MQKFYIQTNKGGFTMQNNTNFNENMSAVFSDLQNFAKSDSVLGDPISIGDKTLVPIMSVTLGYGSTPGKDNQGGQDNNQMTSNGVGLGARVTTNAVVVIDNNAVSMLPTNEKSNMAQLVNNIPQSIMSNIPQSLMSMGQNIAQKIMPQSGQGGNQQNSQQSSQQGMQSNAQQSGEQGVQQSSQQEMNSMSMHSISNGLQEQQ